MTERETLSKSECRLRVASRSSAFSGRIQIGRLRSIIAQVSGSLNQLSAFSLGWSLAVRWRYPPYPNSELLSLAESLAGSFAGSLAGSLVESFAGSLIESLIESLAETLTKTLTKSLADSLVDSLTESLVEALVESLASRVSSQVSLSESLSFYCLIVPLARSSRETTFF